MGRGLHVHIRMCTRTHIRYICTHAAFIMKKVTVIKHDWGLLFKVSASVTKIEENEGIKLHQNIKSIFISVYVLNMFPSIFIF